MRKQIFCLTLNIYPQLISPDPAIIADVQFRKALTHAIDRQAIQDTIVHGLTSVVDSVVSPYSPDYADIEGAIVRYPYDTARALQILGQLGYTRGPDGTIRDNAGRQLSSGLTEGGT